MSEVLYTFIKNQESSNMKRKITYIREYERNNIIDHCYVIIIMTQAAKSAGRNIDVCWGSSNGVRFFFIRFLNRMKEK